MGKFDGKKLLILGTNVGSIDIVQYARSEGAYVIVTDYLPTEKSAAKRAADETAMISTLDVDALIDFAREKEIDGVFCGVSEANLLSVYAIAQALGLPCYFTKEQWDTCQNKAAFKALCEKHGVPVAKRYAMPDDPTEEDFAKISYPAVTKPVDSSAGIGVHICQNAQELMGGYKDAREKSSSHKALVEEYLDGPQFNATYNVCDGEFTLSAIHDRNVNPNELLPIPVPELRVYPSRFIEEYLRDVHDRVIAMMKSVGFTDGTFLIQCIQTKNGPRVIELGLRLGGAGAYRMLGAVNGVNMFHGMTNYALAGKIDLDLSKDDPYLGGKICCVMNVLCRSGKIGRSQGDEAVKRLPGVTSAYAHYAVGDEIPVGIPLKHQYLSLYIVQNSREELIETIRSVHETIGVWDENGENMLIPPLDPEEYV